MRAARVWINGRPGSTVDWRDRGLAYGDGLFETMRVHLERVPALEYHLDRLLGGCRALGIRAPSRRQLATEIARAAAGRRRGVLKLIVTRGAGSRGYRPSGRERSTRILSMHPLPRAAGADGARPVRVRICATRMGASPSLAGLKTLNRLESVLARAEWHDGRIWEGLMLDADENLVSGTMSNVFVRRGALIMTPPLDRCGVAGVMRRRILESALGLGYRAREHRLRWRDLRRSDEVFLSNAVVGVRPVASIERGRERLRFSVFEAAARFRARLCP